MLDSSIFQAFFEIKKLLKEKYPQNSKRYLYLSVMFAIAIIPTFVFDYWIGRLAGIILVSIFFLRIASTKKKNKKS